MYNTLIHGTVLPFYVKGGEKEEEKSRYKLTCVHVFGYALGDICDQSF